MPEPQIINICGQVINIGNIGNVNPSQRVEQELAEARKKIQTLEEIVKELSQVIAAQQENILLLCRKQLDK